MLSEMPRKAKRVNEARKRLKEYKGWVTLPDGSRARKSFYGATLEDAKRRWRETVNPPLKVDVPEGTFVWFYLNKLIPLKGHLRGSSRSFIHDAARHVLPEIGHMKMTDIDFVVIIDMLNRIAAKQVCRNPSAKGKPVRMADGSIGRLAPEYRYKPLSASTVNKCRRLALEVNDVASELDPAVRRINPRRIPVRKETAASIDVYSPPEMKRLLDAAEGTVGYVPVLLYAFLGLRLREGAGLLASDLDSAGVLHVVRQTAKDDDWETVEELKTDYSERHLPLPPGLLEKLNPHRFGGGRLMKNSLKNPMDVDGIDRALNAAMKKARLRRLTPHQLRHSFSSWLEENGCPRSVRLTLMGQSRAAVPDRYNHATPAALRRWLGMLWDASLEAEEEPRVEEAPRIERPRALGESNGRSVLNEEAVRDIRRRIANRETLESIAAIHGVSRRVISKIRDGEAWKHVA
jgi:integrase